MGEESDRGHMVVDRGGNRGQNCTVVGQLHVVHTNGLQLTHEKIQQVQLLFCAWRRGEFLITLGINLCIAKEALFDLAIK